MYSFENRAQPLSFRRIDHFYERHFSMEVRAKVRAAIMILTFRAEAEAIRQHRLQPIKVAAHNIHFLAGDKSGQVLTDSLPHHARLAVIHSEALRLQNGGHCHAETLDAFFKVVVSGKKARSRVKEWLSDFR